MTRLLTLAGLPLLGAISTLFYYKRKVQKMKHLPKTLILTENQFEDFRRKKEQKEYSRPFRKNPIESKERYRYQSIIALVNRKQ